jgi:hypothetical protein
MLSEKEPEEPTVAVPTVTGEVPKVMVTVLDGTNCVPATETE